MTTQPVSDCSATVEPDSVFRTDANPSTISPPKPTSGQRQQGELPDLASLQMIINDPATACHGHPPEQEGAQGGRVEDLAVPPTMDRDAPNEDADPATSPPRYRPAYELADAAHERLGRGTQPPVLTAK